MQGLPTLTRQRTAFPAEPATLHSTPASPLRRAIDRAGQALLDRQRPDGHWVGELQGDTILESEFVLLLAFLGRERDEKVAKAARYILRQQQADGGWSNYPGGPADLSVSVKAYFALKLAGHDPEAPYMKAARRVIRDQGGALRCNSFTKFYLALLGQFPYDNCCSVPPEMLLLPRWAYFHLYAMSSWTRTIVVPLSIFSAYRPIRQLPAELGIRELFLKPPETPCRPCPPSKRLLTWHNFFLGVDRLYKKLEPLLGPLRRRAVARAAAWMRQRFADSDGLGAIFPPMIYTVVALRCLGVADDDVEMHWAMEQLDDLIIEDDDTIRLQPCFSPVWDTALTLIGLADAGLSAKHPAIRGGVRWLLDREARRPGDWSLANPGLEPAGWFFEYRNGFYPDTDDTAMVLMALARSQESGVRGQESGVRSQESGVRSQGPDDAHVVQTRMAIVTEDLPPRIANRGLRTADHGPADLWPLITGHLGADALPRGLHWLLAMQNSDGGWAAFDRNINREVLTKVPFADHNAMLDPSCPDITARVLEALGHYGYTMDHPPVARGLAFLGRTQEANGSWPGRWGVNYIYGTWQVLQGLARIGVGSGEPMVRRAVAWLEKVQQPGGGWGESCRSYDDPAWAGKGTPTASQTAWALLGLLAAGEADSPAVRGGIDWLLRTQQPDGSWHEDEFTGTGFPKVFYLKYHMYSHYFPLMALARYAGEPSGVSRRVQHPGVDSESGS